jgi:pyridoxal phosphate enzyme (YggS family)
LDYQKYVEQTEARILAACLRSGRDRNEVNLIAVTKYIDTQGARELLRCGLIHIAENRWQVAKDKWEAIGEEASWHFIGHLQTNKVKDVVGRFTYIHSLDRIELLHEIHKKADQRNVVTQAFIQVNISGEPSKYGLSPEDVIPFVNQLHAYPHVKVIGLMTMAPYADDPEAARPVFRGLRELRDELNEREILPERIQHLSMGMSGDFEVAIEEGATWLRLGSILIGKE